MQDIIPNFEANHLFAEQTIVLRINKGEYGRVVGLFPLDMNGDPDVGRRPHFTGHMHIVGHNAQGQQFQIPLSFAIPVSDLLMAAREFKACAQKAIEEFQSESFRRNLAKPGVITQ